MRTVAETVTTVPHDAAASALEPGAWAPPTDVHVAGLDAVGAAIAHALAGAGALRLALWDPRPVDAADLGTGLLP
ncbi:dinucleotide-utilizing protein, partial [Micrococcus luteus]